MDLAKASTTWTYPNTVVFGVGGIAKLARACQSAGIMRPLVVTDPGVAELASLRDAVRALDDAGLEPALFSDIRPNPTGRNVEDGIAAFRAGGHDGVVAIGGGSALDAGKAIAFMSVQTRPIWDFEDIGENWKRAAPAPVPSVIAVPTTAGTGSEVGRAAVITDEATHTKRIVFHPRMLPVAALCDPALTTGLPPQLTAATGMDALAHCLEAYCAPGFHPMAEGIAVEGMRLVFEALPRAFGDGQDLAARAKMMAAATMGAVAFQKGLGAIHSLSHPLGALYDVHHGLANAVVMPYVLAFNRHAIEDKCTRLAAWLGLAPASFDGLLDRIVALRGELGIPHSIADLGLGALPIARLAEMAALDPTAAGNPVPVGPQALAALYERACEGRLG